MVCMAKVSRSNTSFQKVKYLFPIYNSSKIIGNNKFYFQKTCYMFELTFPSGSTDEKNYLNVYGSCFLCCISGLSIPSITKEYFTYFLKCHNKAWFRPTTQAYQRQWEHRRHKRRLNNASCRTTREALNGEEEEIIRASNWEFWEMICEICVSIDQVWTCCIRAYARTCVCLFVCCLFLSLHHSLNQA